MYADIDGSRPRLTTWAAAPRHADHEPEFARAVLLVSVLLVAALDRRDGVAARDGLAYSCAVEAPNDGVPGRRPVHLEHGCGIEI
jgi:hypothetical protein